MASNTKKRLKRNGIGMTLLVLMLMTSTFALILSIAEVKQNEFLLGEVAIEVNDGKIIFHQNDMLLEPERTLVKEVKIENKGTADVYYRLYLDNVKGHLKDALRFQIYDQDELLFDGNAAQLSKENPCISHAKLLKGETRMLMIHVKMERHINHQPYQGSDMMFDVVVDAVQSKNNPDKEFE